MLITPLSKKRCFGAWLIQTTRTLHGQPNCESWRARRSWPICPADSYSDCVSGYKSESELLVRLIIWRSAHCDLLRTCAQLSNNCNLNSILIRCLDVLSQNITTLTQLFVQFGTFCCAFHVISVFVRNPRSKYFLFSITTTGRLLPVSILSPSFDQSIYLLLLVFFFKWQFLYNLH